MRLKKAIFFITKSMVLLVCIQQYYWNAEPVIATESNAADTFVIPSSTKIAIVLQEALDCHQVTGEQQVRACLKENILIGGKVCLPANSLMYGYASNFNQLSKWPAYCLSFDSINLSTGQSIPIAAIPVVRGLILKVTRHGQVMFFHADVGSDKMIDKDHHRSHIMQESGKMVGIIRGTRQISPDLKEGDEITVETVDDIRSNNLTPVNSPKMDSRITNPARI
jgi:hypothetical protein